ncbi:MAG: hypothetical protein LBH73_01525 [Spirochaetaceae bacterium]|jgi:hypothetical protein|nr:hypothetical protein [Spirochaetaceae bacterium]
MAVPRPEQYDESRIEKLRKLIDNKDYLEQAIHHIARIVSNEIVQGPVGEFAGSPVRGEGVPYNE